jgi:hypothetical protein
LLERKIIMGHHIFYIDDSGTKEYAKAPNLYSPKGGNTRYFCFGGVLVNEKESDILSTKIASHKINCFGTDKVEIKSNWLRMPRERDAHYLNEYQISEKDLERFVDELYGMVSSSELLFMAAIVDKQHMYDDYGDNAWYPPALAYEILSQRVVQEILHPNTVSVIIDDMDGATPKGTPHKINLERHHNSLRKNGSCLKEGLDWKPFKGMKFINSANSHLIQIADIVAYNVYRQFVEYGEDWESKLNTELPVYKWFDKLANKFRNDNGRIQGYGVIKIPRRGRKMWSIKE